MKKQLLALALAGTFTTSVFAAETALETEQQKLSYAVGMLVSDNVLKNFEDLDYDLFSEAMKTHHEGGETSLSMEEAQNLMRDYQMKAAEAEAKAQAEQAAAAAAEAKAIGTTYLAENAAKEGVMVTDTGLQYEVLTAAEGAKPSVDDTVTVHYVGTTIDGTEFDSSIARGEPAQFPLKGVIPGWTEGLQLMNVGSKVRFVIPSDLAYGDRGAGQNIGPGETLIFEVELLEIAAQQ